LEGTLYTSGDFRRLEEAAAGELRELKRNDPSAEAIFVAGSNLLCAYLRKRLSVMLGGLFNVRFLTFPDLVSIVEERSGTVTRDPLPPLASRVILDELAAGDVPRCFSEVAVTGGFSTALQSTFTDLSEGGCDAAAAGALIASGDPGLSSERALGVLELFARYRDIIESRGGDIHSRFSRATSAAAAALAGCAVYAYGFYDLNELQYRLLATAMREGPSALFVPWRDEAPYRFAEPLAGRLKAEGFEHEPIDGGPAAAPETVLFSAPDAVEEAREVVRRIIEMREQGGPGFGETAILPWSNGDWPPLREALEEARIPWYSRISSYRAADPLRTGALRLLEVLCGDGGRSGLVDFLISSPVSAGAGGGAGTDPFALWVRLSAGEGMRGETGWDAENARLLEKVRRHEEQTGAGEGTRRSRMLEIAADAISVIEKARKEFADAEGWRGFSSAFAGAVSALFGADAAADVVRTVEGLASLDDISAHCDAGRFRRTASAALAGGSESAGRFGGDGVNVILAGQARGLRFETVFMTGLREGSVPGRARQDPFIKDSEREAIARISRGSVRLSIRGGRIEESALVFRIACSSASSRLDCSWPRLETGGNREFMPTSYMRFVPGLPAGPSERSAEAVRIPMRGRPEGTEVPLGEDDYDFLMSGRRLGKSIHYPSSVFFGMGTSLIRARWGTRRFTPYDGVFESPMALAEIDAAMARNGWNLSATTLQSWAECPFAFLAEKLIGVESVEEPERELTIDPMQRGTLTHLVLERLYSELSRGRLFPLSEATLPAALEAARRVARETLDAYESAEPVGHPLLWEYERETIAASVMELLSDEARESSGSVPTMFEAWFGGDPPDGAVTFEAGGRTLSFYGKIDRIDLTPDGGYTVIDYKTGRIAAKDQDLEGGSSLQLPVYLLAASNLLGIPVEDGRAMLRSVGTGGGRKKAIYSGAEWKTGRSEFARVLGVIVDGITSGYFFVSPRAAGCDYCGVRQACPTGREWLFAVKAAGDARAADYLDMRGISLE
jgi:ATP-dependent helicase/nuclease subunit B